MSRDWVLGKMNRGLKEELRFDLGSGDSEAFFVGNSRGVFVGGAHVIQVVVRRGPKNLIYISGNHLAKITTRLGGWKFQIRKYWVCCMY
jgi:hypothetical protein